MTVDAGDPASLRLANYEARDVLLRHWCIPDEAGTALGEIERDTLAIIKRAAEARRDLAVLVPSGVPHLPLLAGVLVELAEARRVAPRGVGPTVMVTPNAVRRRELEALVIAGEDALPAVHAQRLRHDGLACSFAGSRPTVVRPEPGLLFVNPQVGWPEVIGKIDGAVIVDMTPLRDAGRAGELLTEARHWAVRNDVQPLIAFASLGAAYAVPGSMLRWPLDWAYLRTARVTGVDASSSSSTGLIDALVINDDRVGGLERARQLLRSAGRTDRPWPSALGNAARLARLLVDLPVPCDVFDAHVVHAVARTLAERRDLLDDTSASELGPGWELFAETDWAVVRRGILDAYDALSAVNRKSLGVASVIEDSLREGRLVDLVASNATAAAALRTWLFSSGVAVSVQDLADERLRVRYLSLPTAWDQRRVTVLAGLPPAALLWRFDGADLGRITIVCYPVEATTVGSAFERTFAPIEPRAAAVQRQATLAELMRADAALRVPQPVTVHLQATSAVLPSAVSDPFAFLDTPAQDYRFDPLEEDGDDPLTATPGPVGVWRVEVGPAADSDSPRRVVHVRVRARLDRIIGDTLSSVRPDELVPGMLIIGLLGDGRSIFERVRPFLDVLWGSGTRTWLVVWDAGREAALARCHGASRVAEQLTLSGITITADAVAAWDSPYRIGPADARVIGVVGELGGNPALADHSKSIYEAMERARRAHRRVGRGIAAAARHYVAGDMDAFAELEARLGVDLADATGDLTPWRILTRPIPGMCSPGLVGRLVDAATPGFVVSHSDESSSPASSELDDASRDEQPAESREDDT